MLYKARKAKHYDEWKEYNLKLDKIEGNQTWKEFPESSYYNQEIVKANLQRLNQIILTSLSPEQNPKHKQIDLDDLKFIDCFSLIRGMNL